MLFAMYNSKLRRKNMSKLGRMQKTQDTKDKSIKRKQKKTKALETKKGSYKHKKYGKESK